MFILVLELIFKAIIKICINLCESVAAIVSSDQYDIFQNAHRSILTFIYRRIPEIAYIQEITS